MIWTCGVDEAGRGPLAGSVVAAAVVLDPEHPIDGLDDSKKLSPRTRERLALEIRAKALAWAVAEASVEEIDRLNILHASLLAMRRAVEQLAVPLRLALIDGHIAPRWAVPTQAIVGGDALEPAISAASILAKTVRDEQMRQLHLCYPLFGFDRHKGYPTAAHLQALNLHGATPFHRRSFAPVQAMLMQGRLFQDVPQEGAVTGARAQNLL